MDLTKEQFLDRTHRAWRARFPGEIELAFRTQLDAKRDTLRAALKAGLAEFDREFLKWMQMHSEFARREVRRSVETQGNGWFFTLLVAAYVFARERVAADARWRPPPVGGTDDAALDDSCLIHLLVKRSHKRIAPSRSRPQHDD